MASLIIIAVKKHTSIRQCNSDSLPIVDLDPTHGLIERQCLFYLSRVSPSDMNFPFGTGHKPIVVDLLKAFVFPASQTFRKTLICEIPDLKTVIRSITSAQGDQSVERKVQSLSIRSWSFSSGWT